MLSFASFRQAHTKTIDEMKKRRLMLRFYLLVPIMIIIFHQLKNIRHCLVKFSKEEKAKALNHKLSEEVKEAKSN